jgi:ABC-2 type transport system permease protein
MFWLLSRLFRWLRERQQGTDPEVAEGDPSNSADAPLSSESMVAVARRHADAPSRPSPGSRGPIALLIHQTRFELLAAMRNPRARFFTLLFPIILLVVFNGVFGHKGHTIVDGHTVKLTVFFTGGILALSIIVSSYAGLLMTVTTARETGVFKRRRATPVPPAVLIGGTVLATIVISLWVSAVLLVIARLAYSISMPATALISVFITVVVGTISFACIGYAVSGLITSVDAAQPLAQATLLPLYFISGVWIPTSSLSHGLRDVASVFPVEHLAASLHKATVATSFSSAFSATDLLVLAAWGLAAGLLATMRFSWLPHVATA